jgi:hypothetical protein
LINPTARCGRKTTAGRAASGNVERKARKARREFPEILLGGLAGFAFHPVCLSDGAARVPYRFEWLACRSGLSVSFQIL